MFDSRAVMQMLNDDYEEEPTYKIRNCGPHHDRVHVDFGLARAARAHLYFNKLKSGFTDASITRN